MADSERRGFWNTNEQSVHRSQLSRLASRSKVCAGFIRSLPQSGQKTYRSMNKSGAFTNAIPIIEAAAPRISRSVDHSYTSLIGAVGRERYLPPGSGTRPDWRTVAVLISGSF